MVAGYIAEQADEGWVKAKTISAKYGLPKDYLFRIMEKMIIANILRSKRGPAGGYMLARPAKEITLLEIIETAGGPISCQLELAELSGNAGFSIEMENVCRKASEKAASILSRATLSQMVG
jgi:Rrf2 family protein